MYTHWFINTINIIIKITVFRVYMLSHLNIYRYTFKSYLITYFLYFITIQLPIKTLRLCRLIIALL